MRTFPAIEALEGTVPGTQEHDNIRAATGAAWLDRVTPGWASKIDVELLDVKSVSSCVLAQLMHEQYRNRFLTSLDPEMSEDEFWGRDGFVSHEHVGVSPISGEENVSTYYDAPYTHGFTYNSSLEHRGSRDGSVLGPQLTAAWVSEITKRKQT